MSMSTRCWQVRDAFIQEVQLCNNGLNGMHMACDTPTRGGEPSVESPQTQQASRLQD